MTILIRFAFPQEESMEHLATGSRLCGPGLCNSKTSFLSWRAMHEQQAGCYHLQWPYILCNNPPPFYDMYKKQQQQQKRTQQKSKKPQTNKKRKHSKTKKNILLNETFLWRLLFPSLFTSPESMARIYFGFKVNIFDLIWPKVDILDLIWPEIS